MGRGACNGWWSSAPSDFRLAPKGPFVDSGATHRQVDLKPGLSTDYRPAVPPALPPIRLPAEIDPEVADRGTRGHVDTQNALAAHISSLGLRPLSPGLGDPAFDLAWIVGELVYVAEVKSLTASNETRQLRLGLGQVLDYQDAIQAAGRPCLAVLAVERRPSDARWERVCERHDVILTWPESFKKKLAKGARSSDR